MKTPLIIIIIAISLTAFLNCGKAVSGSLEPCVPLTIPAGTYKYPVPFGNPDWSLYQIPDSIVKPLTTPALIQSLVDNPNLALMNVYSGFFVGRDIVLKKLNASTELNKRPNAASEMQNRYQQMNPNCYPSGETLLNQGNYLDGWIAFEKIFSQDSILNQFSSVQKKNLVKICIEKHHQKAMLGDVFGTCKTSGVLLISEIMRQDRYTSYINELSSNTELKSYTQSGATADHELMRGIIIDFANRYIK